MFRAQKEGALCQAGLHRAGSSGMLDSTEDAGVCVYLCVCVCYKSCLLSRDYGAVI